MITHYGMKKTLRNFFNHLSAQFEQIKEVDSWAYDALMKKCEEIDISLCKEIEREKKDK